MRAPSRTTFALSAVATALTMGCSTAQADPTAERDPGAAIGALADLSALRIQIADLVAAAKWGTDQAIDDPVRERALLTDVRQRSVTLGLDPSVTTALFRDQIEANKVVQRGLHARWTAYPNEVPARRPDLAKEVRPQLDRITGELLAQLAAAQSIRTDGACYPHLAIDFAGVAAARQLDLLHMRGLADAVASVCAAPTHL